MTWIWIFQRIRKGFLYSASNLKSAQSEQTDYLENMDS